MKKRVLYLIVVMALLMGMAFPMATSVVAQVVPSAAISSGKVAVQEPDQPVHPPGVYVVGQTIYYELIVTNHSLSDEFVLKIADQIPIDRTTWGPIDGVTEMYWWNTGTEEWDEEDPETPVTIPPNESWEGTFEYEIIEDGVLKHPEEDYLVFVNRFIASVDPEDRWAAPGTSATRTVRVIEPEIELEKTVEPEQAKVGDIVTYTFTITNTGDWPLESITLVDDELGDLTDELTPGLVLAPQGQEDDSYTFDYEYIIQEGDLPLTNEATVTGTAEGFDPDIDGAEVSHSDTAEVTLDDIAARISISPLEGTNAIGDDHDLTALVEVHTGDDWEPYEGATVTFEVIDGVGSVAPETDDTDADGEAETVLTSDEPGSSTVEASTTITINGLTFDLVTDGTGQNSDPAEKDWVAARISIAPPEDTNAVGDAHELTALVEVYTDDDWEPYEGATVTFEVIDGVGTVDPVTDDTDAAGEAKTVLTSDVPGSSTVQASTTITVDNAEITLVTDGEEGDSDAPAVKTWVDARISIVQSGTNPVNEPHTFTVTIEKHEGDGAGWVPAVGVTVTPSHSGVGSITSSPPYVTDALGQVTVTVNSDDLGVATVDATATVTVNGIDIAVATDGYGAHVVSNQKTWVDEPPITVGWDGQSVNKVAVMAPWIALMAGAMAGAVLFLRRRQAQG